MTFHLYDPTGRRRAGVIKVKGHQTVVYFSKHHTGIPVKADLCLALLKPSNRHFLSIELKYCVKLEILFWDFLYGIIYKRTLRLIQY